MTTKLGKFLGRTSLLLLVSSLGFAVGNTAKQGLDVTNKSGSGVFTYNTSGTITAPNGTDTLMGKATTDTMTNKSISTGGTNTIGATAISGVTGTGSVVMSAAPTFTGNITGATEHLTGGLTTDTQSTFGSSTSNGIMLSVNAAAGVLSGTVEQGLQVTPLCNSGATTSCTGIYAQASTANSSFTDTSLYDLFLATPTKGAASTVTTAYGLYIDSITAGSTNYSFFTNGTAQSRFGGKLGIKMDPTNDLDVTGTFGVTGTSAHGGVATFTAQPIMSSLTVSLPVFTDGSKGLVSNAMTGTGSVVMSASPTLTGTMVAASATFSGTGTFNRSAGAYTTAALANSTTTLTAGSTQHQYFTGTTTGQILKLPATNAAGMLGTGDQFIIHNLGTGSATIAIQDSGAGALQTEAITSTCWLTVLTVGSPGTWDSFCSTNGAGGGTVTSVAASVPAFLSIAGSPVTTAGTLAITLSGTALPVANGGTGLTSGTSGGVLAYTASGTLASSGALTANQVVIGGGAGVAPSTLAAGSQYQSLTMGAANPAWSAINLGQAAATTGTLPHGAGGTDVTSPSTAGNGLVSDGTSWKSVSQKNSSMLYNIGFKQSVAASSVTISLTQSDGSTNCASTDPCIAAFRSSTAASAALNLRSVTGALSASLASGTTLGLKSSVNQTLWVYLIDSDGSGTMKLGFSGAVLNEGSLQSAVQDNMSATATNASPCVFTAASNNYVNGDGVQLGGTPPTGFSSSTTYYIVNSGTDGAGKFRLAALPGGTAINSSSTGSAIKLLPSTARLVSDGNYTSEPVRTIGKAVFNITAGTWAAPAEMSVGTLQSLSVPVNPTIQALTSSSGTYVLPQAPPPLWIEVKMVGGGGGGAGSGTGAPGAGGTGGSTTFGTSLLTCAGGVGGGTGGGNGGAGGAATTTGGTLITGIQGSYGGAGGSSAANGSFVGSGVGGSSPFGGAGGNNGNGAGFAGQANSGSGGGGSGTAANSASGVGGGGGAGAFLDVVFTSSTQSAAYAYAIGAAGAAGSAGTSGSAGGAGGSGYIVVVEHYQ